jgi:transposase
MFQRKDLGDLSAQHRLQFLGAVDKAKLQGRTMKEVAPEWGLNKNCYARWTKQLVEEGSLESKKSRAGRPPKLQAEHYEKLRKLNRQVLDVALHGEAREAMAAEDRGVRLHLVERWR